MQLIPSDSNNPHHIYNIDFNIVDPNIEIKANVILTYHPQNYLVDDNKTEINYKIIFESTAHVENIVSIVVSTIEKVKIAATDIENAVNCNRGHVRSTSGDYLIIHYRGI